MRIDIVESMWADLEQSFKNSKLKSRRDYLKGLVSFNGAKGAVKGLEAAMKIDLDGQASSIDRYNSLCNMLEAAEDWLIRCPDEISDLNQWLRDLANSSKLDLEKLIIIYKSKASNNLLQAIQFGYVFPGLYGKQEVMTFNAEVNGYHFYQNAAEMSAELKNLLAVPASEHDTQTNLFINALSSVMSRTELTFPCVFVDRELLRSPIYKYHTDFKIDDGEVPVIPKSKVLVHSVYEVGHVNVSAGTSLLTVIIGG